MIGVKARIFAPQASLTLNDLVPQDHFYRHLERALDLSFVRDPVKRAELASHNLERHDWFVHNGAPERRIRSGCGDWKR